MRSGHFIGVFFMASLPLGCAHWQNAEPASVETTSIAEQQRTSAMQLIAEDFVIALQQIPGLSPASTTVQLLQSDADDPFTRHMRHALQAVGYGARWVKGDAHSPLFQYRHEAVADREAKPEWLYEIAVGNVEMRRRFAMDQNGQLKPATPLYVRGADASQVVMDDTRFDRAPRLASVATSAAPVPVRPAAEKRLTAITPQSLTVPQDANPLNPLIAGTDRQRELGLPLLDLPRVENVFERGGSNFADVLADSLLVREQILTFANDSLRLGAVNKTLVEQMVESFQPETDVFSVLGCSLGPTQLKSGNAALALGRASRVREALLFAGVPQNRILDEGCWADDGSGKALPRRGVVVTLNRKT